MLRRYKARIWKKTLFLKSEITTQCCLHAISRNKNFNALIDNKPFIDQSLKNKQIYEKFIKMTRNDDYTTGNLLDYLYHQKYYKLIGIDLSRQTNMSIPQQINSTVKLEENDSGKCFLSLKSSKELF